MNLPKFKFNNFDEVSLESGQTEDGTVFVN